MLRRELQVTRQTIIPHFWTYADLWTRTSEGSFSLFSLHRSLSFDFLALQVIDESALFLACNAVALLGATGRCRGSSRVGSGVRSQFVARLRRF